MAAERVALFWLSLALWDLIDLIDLEGAFEADQPPLGIDRLDRDAGAVWAFGLSALAHVGPDSK